VRHKQECALIQAYSGRWVGGVGVGDYVLQHSSGKCVHPEGGSDTPDNSVKLVFRDGCDTNRNEFLFTPIPAGGLGGGGDYVLQHKSGKCVHPEGGSDTPDNGVKLVFYDGCDTNRNAFLFKPGLSFQAAASAVTSMIGVIVISLLWL
jgi:hypothetical protein